MLTFTEDEVRRIIGKPVDILAKYETAHQHGDQWCNDFSIDDDDSDEIVGEKIALQCNFAADVSCNGLRDEQLRRMMAISGVVK